MFHRKTLFVLGAGASQEVGFPIGSELTTQIGEELRAFGDPSRAYFGGNNLIEQALELQTGVGRDISKLQSFREAALLMAQAMPLAGSIAIIFFGALFPLWPAAIGRPNRVEITNEGFSVRQVFFGTKTYFWNDIEQIGVPGRGVSKLVCWTYKVRPQKLAFFEAIMGRSNNYDGYLPAGWRVSANEVAEEMHAASADFSRRANAA